MKAKYLIAIFVGSLCSFDSIAQVITTVTLKNQDNQSVVNAVVIIDSAQKDIDHNGTAVFDLNKEGTYLLQVFANSFKPVSKQIEVKNGSIFNLILDNDNVLLSDILIESKSESQQTNRAIIRSIVVDTKSEIAKPVSLVDLMNKTTGIRVRQSGGLGSQANINLNGFSGNAIRIFKDGIPINYLGEGYSISNVPLDLLERVEVYKGIVPVNLATDALGGAVNLISPANKANTLRGSAEYGSFNTFRGALRLHQNLNDHAFVGLEAFYNYSDNDYKIKTPNAEIAKTKSKVKLFHNRYKHLYTNVYAGFNNLKWADLIQLDLSYYNLEKELQNSPTTMLTPYGAIEDKQHSFIPSLRYKKTLFDERLSIDQFVSYNVVKMQAIDTLKGRYNWLGEFTPRGYRGEGDHPMDADIDMTFFTSRTLLGYSLDAHNQLWLNNTYNYTKRKGTDPYGKKIEDTQQTIVELPTKYKKNTIALGLTSQWLNNKLETNVIAKLYNYSSEGLNTAHNVDLKSTDIYKTNGEAFGWALGAKYKLSNDYNVRFSIEDARRLPGYTELFGDYIFIASNFDLKPEKSINLNLGIDKEEGIFKYSLSGFYRQTKDIIVLVSGNPPLSVYVNKERANGYGFEGDFKVQMNKNFSAFTNFTWQSIRYGKFSQASDKWMKGSRVPNLPFFFANIGLEAKFEQLFLKDDAITVYSNLNFVREFYIQAIDKSMEPSGFLGLFGHSKGDVKNIVPDQTTVNLGALYELKSQGLSLGIEVRNLFNQELYDYFKIQKAGRSFYLKLNYKLN